LGWTGLGQPGCLDERHPPRRRLETAPVAQSDEFSAIDDDWLVGGSSRMLLRLSGQGRLVAGVKIVAGA